MKSHILLSLFVGAVFPLALTTPLGAVGAGAGSGGAGAAATLPVPLERYYALVRPFDGHPDEKLLTIKRITPSGRLLLEKYFSSSTGVQSGTVVGYRWYQGTSQAISGPVSPWIYGGVKNLNRLGYSVHDMNDAGDIAGMASSHFIYYDNNIQRDIDTGENLWIVWPSATSNAPVLVNPGIADTVTRLHTYSYISFLYPRIDNAGRIFGIGSVSEWSNKYPNAPMSYRELGRNDLFSTTAASAPTSRITNNLQDTYGWQQITDITPLGKMLVDRQKDDGINREMVVDQTVFPHSYISGQHAGYAPSVINDSNRVAGHDNTLRKLAWRTLADPTLQYLEGLYAQDMNEGGVKRLVHSLFV